MGDVDQQQTGQPEGVEAMETAGTEDFGSLLKRLRGRVSLRERSPGAPVFPAPTCPRSSGGSAFPAPTCCASWPASTGWTPTT